MSNIFSYHKISHINHKMVFWTKNSRLSSRPGQGQPESVGGRNRHESDIERPGPAQDFAEDDGAPEIVLAADAEAKRLPDAATTVGAVFGGGRKGRRQALTEQRRGGDRRRQGWQRRTAVAIVKRWLGLQGQALGRNWLQGVDAQQFIQKLRQTALAGRRCRWPQRLRLGLGPPQHRARLAPGRQRRGERTRPTSIRTLPGPILRMRFHRFADFDKENHADDDDKKKIFHDGRFF